nr:hypothetical protein [Lachnospiraceae bacterium]
IQVIDINGDVHETSVNVVEAGEAEDNAASALPERTLAQVAQNLLISDETNYAYGQLRESTRNCYREIYAILTEMLEKIEISSTDPDEVDLAFRAVMVDHPEIFYVKGYSIIKYVSAGSLKKIAFSGTYTMTPEAVSAAKDEVERYVDDMLAGCPEGAGDYEKIKYVYDRLILENEYDTASENNQNILSVIENGRTVCQGYTKVMQLVLARMDIFCTLVNGSACGRNGVPSAGELDDAENAEWGGHVWNIVRCNGLYYNVDVTWGDAAITLLNSDGSLSRDIDVNYEFFLVDDTYLDRTHAPEPVVSMPKCNSMEDSYYRHEGLYFTEVDRQQFYRAFESALASGETLMYVKAATPEVYEELDEHLFKNENVFEYIGRSNVKYVEFPERNLIMISL